MMKGGNAVGKSYADEQFELYFEKYSKQLEKFCAVRLEEASDFAGDCVQEAFCVFYRKLLDGEKFENPRAFLYQTANNMMLRARKEYFKNAKHTKNLDDAENVAVYIEKEVEERIEPDDVDIDKAKEVLLSVLDDDERRLYQLKYVERKSLKDISKILDITPTAAAKRTSRLRAKITNSVTPVLSEFRKGGS